MRLVLTLAVLCGVAVQAFAGNRAGTVSAQFLKMPVNARATAMGNAQVAIAQGASSIAYNPAGMLSVANIGVGGTYNMWFADITHSFVGAAVNLQEWGTVGVGMMTLGTDDMVVRTHQFPEGTGELFRAADYAVTFSYARQVSQEFGLGLSAKYVKSYLYNSEITAAAVAFDIGTLYDIPALSSRLGISVNNLGSDLKYIHEQYSLPTALRFGIRTTMYQEEHHLLHAVLQIGRPNDADEQYNLGFEYDFDSMVFLRTGYRFNHDTENWSLGVGVGLESIGIDGSFDYAFTNYRYLSGTHMFSLEVGF
jgi:hypothetical protein